MVSSTLKLVFKRTATTTPVQAVLPQVSNQRTCWSVQQIPSTLKLVLSRATHPSGTQGELPQVSYLLYTHKQVITKRKMNYVYRYNS